MIVGNRMMIAVVQSRHTHRGPLGNLRRGNDVEDGARCADACDGTRTQGADLSVRDDGALVARHAAGYAVNENHSSNATSPTPSIAR